MLVVGKLKENYLELGITEYIKRLSSYAKCKIIEIAEERAPDKLTKALENQIKQKEGERLFSLFQKDTYVIALAIQGKQFSSELFAHHIQELSTHGISHLTFVIGGSYGLSEQLLSKADMYLSFGIMTYPHQLMRLILVEQIYRALKINRGETYHK